MANISAVDICNRALQLLGQEVISSLTQNTKSSRSVALAYDIARRAELRAHPWNFAIKRANLAESSTPPLYGKANYFPLPNDFIRLLNTDPEKNYNTIDYEIEGNQIASDYPAPLQIRYLYDCQDTTLFDDLFNEAVAARVARSVCEQLTQSNAKLQAINDYYKETMNEARRVNAYEQISAQPATDPYLTVRI